MRLGAPWWGTGHGGSSTGPAAVGKTQGWVLGVQVQHWNRGDLCPCVLCLVRALGPQGRNLRLPHQSLRTGTGKEPGAQHQSRKAGPISGWLFPPGDRDRSAQAAGCSAGSGTADANAGRSVPADCGVLPAHPHQVPLKQSPKASQVGACSARSNSSAQILLRRKGGALGLQSQGTAQRSLCSVHSLPRSVGVM